MTNGEEIDVVLSVLEKDAHLVEVILLTRTADDGDCHLSPQDLREIRDRLGRVKVAGKTLAGRAEKKGGGAKRPRRR